MHSLARIGLVALTLLVAVLVIGCAKDKKPAEADSSKSAQADALAKGEKPFDNCEDIATGKAPTPQVVAAGIHYGPEFKVAEKDTVSVDTLLADPAAYNGKVVRISGKVTEVCAVKGCWLTFGNTKSAETVFVKFVDPPAGRLVPVKAQGHEIIAEGTFKIGQVSESFARHLVIDAGGSKEEAEKIVGVQKKLMLMTPAVTINGLQ